jgi:hypothetical protein
MGDEVRNARRVELRLRRYGYFNGGPTALLLANMPEQALDHFLREGRWNVRKT